MVSDGIAHVCTLWLLATTFFVITFVSSPTTNNSLEIVDLQKPSKNQRTSRSYQSTQHSNGLNKDIYINDKSEDKQTDSSNQSKVQYRIRRGLRGVLEDSATTGDSIRDEQTINNEDYYTYDYYADAVEEENMPTRNKRSSAVLLDESNSEFLLKKLAEMVGSFDSKYIPNFTTPNPNIEITIEVINGVDHDEDIYYSNNEIGSWGDWTACSVSCGHGLRQRSRSCYSARCVASETQECDFHPCPETTSVESTTTSVAVTVAEKDNCAEWMTCKDQLTPYFEGLPNCPCSYPTTIFDSGAIWDKEAEMWFNWEDASRNDDHLEIFKPTARYCIRSLHSERTTSSASQQCCYNDNLKLITRGPGAGTPQLISSKISPELHYKIDVLPWIICKGDWTKYNEVRIPNNEAGCREFPSDSDMRRYIEQVKDF